MGSMGPCDYIRQTKLKHRHFNYSISKRMSQTPAKNTSFLVMAIFSDDCLPPEHCFDS